MTKKQNNNKQTNKTKTLFYIKKKKINKKFFKGFEASKCHFLNNCHLVNFEKKRFFLAIFRHINGSFPEGQIYKEFLWS